MLFRQRNGQQLLVLFIIGEQPDTGVNPTTLRSALDQVAWLSEWRDNHDARQHPRLQWLRKLTQQPARVIYLVGPAYSTSRTELNITLRNWRKSFEKSVPQVIAVSGSATGVLSHEEGVGHLVSDADLYASEEPNYFSTLVQDETLWPLLFSDLQNGPEKADAKFEDSSQDDTSTSGDSARKLFALLVPDNAPTLPGKIIKRILFVPYPTHISDVRTAFGKVPTEAETIRRPLGHRDLGIADESGDEQPDVIPAFSDRSAMYDELSMSSLFGAIHRERIHYVGIIANDIEDLVFLVRQLRLWCPDTIIFTDGADLRFLHSDVNSDLQGMLVFSTYPLFGLNQSWTSRRGVNPRMYQFSSDEAEGVYNATLKLLAAFDPTIDPKLGFETVEYGAPFVDYGSLGTDQGHPLVNRLPVLWVSVVGADGLWPVAFHYVENHAHRLYADRGGDKPGRKGVHYWYDLRAKAAFNHQFKLDWIPYPSSFKFGGFALMVLCVIPSLLFLSQYEQSETRNWRSSLFQILQPTNSVWRHMLTGPSKDGLAGDREIDEMRAVYLTTFLIILLLTYLLWTSFVLLPIISGFKLQHPHAYEANTFQTLWSMLYDAHQALRAVLSDAWAASTPQARWALLGDACQTLPAVLFAFIDFITFVLLCAATGKAIISAFHRASPSMLSPFRRYVPLLVAAVLFILGLGFVISIYLEPVPMRLFEFFRASHLWNGVSPLHPLLLIGIAGLCMAVCGLRALNLLQECRIKAPFLGIDRGTVSFFAIGKGEEEIAQRLECPFYQLPLARVINTIIIAAGVYFILLRQWNVNEWFGWRTNPVDGPWFFWLFNTSFIVVYLLFSRSLLRFVTIWWSLRKLLRVLYWHPSRTAYEELRQKTVPDRPEAQHITLFEPRPSLAAMEAALTFARDLLQSANETRAKTQSPRPYSLSDRLAKLHNLLDSRLCKAEALLTSAIRTEADGNPVAAIRARRAAQVAITGLSEVVAGVFEPFWRAFLQPSTPVLSADDKELLESGRLFIAVRVVDYLRQVFPQMLNLAGFSMAAALAMTLAVSGYPFQDHDTMLWFSWIVLLSVIATILIVFVQINRDRVVSMLVGTTPGKLDWNSSFLSQLLIFGIVPVLTLLGAQFPHALNGILSWIGGLFGGGK
jgi:hypothetical protein